MFGFFLSNFFENIWTALHPQPSSPADSYWLEGEQLVHLDRDGKVTHFAVNELKSVRIVTTDQGPWLDDVFFLIETKQGECLIVEHSEALHKGITDRLAKLPGYDFEATIKAMGCTDNASFLVWQAG